jgi:precorrin-4/cobalt-precorrin-4 C11-methyltransferase
MLTRRLFFVFAVLMLIPISHADAAASKTGKFYIIGMGSSPDLVTLRAVDVMRKADLFMLESKEDVVPWKQYLGKKQVIYAPHLARVFYGTDPATLTDPAQKAVAEKNVGIRKDLVATITKAVKAGKTVAYLQWGDPMMFGNLYLLEMLPPEIPTEIVPGVGSFQAGTAALKRSTVYGRDTNSVILTMEDWPTRTDTNEKLMATQTSMVFYTMHIKYPELFAKLSKAYPAETPVAIVSYAGDPKMENILYSTVGTFLKEVDWANLPPEMHTLFVGKFLKVGQARNDGLAHGRTFIEEQHSNDLPAPTSSQESWVP